jgi:hypothetical protein
MLASPADGSDGKIASTLIRACVMGLFDPHALRVHRQAYDCTVRALVKSRRPSTSSSKQAAACMLDE